MSSEALSCLQGASAKPAPRALISYTHLLSGSCLAHMVHIHNARTAKNQHGGLSACSKYVCVCICLQRRPQMALQCYRKALETDSRCVCALYRSTLIYRQLGNAQAEIHALRILHSVSNSHSKHSTLNTFSETKGQVI